MNARVRLSLSFLLTVLLVAALLMAACNPTTRVAPARQPTATAVPTASPATTASATAAATKAPTAATAAATAMPSATPRPTPAAALGSEQILGGLAVLPSEIEELTASGDEQPRIGYTYQVVTVTIRNTGTTAVDFDPAALTLIDTLSGRGFAPTELKALTNALKAQPIAPGAELTGAVAYHVPKASVSRLEFMFTHANQAVTWSIRG